MGINKKYLEAAKSSELFKGVEEKVVRKFLISDYICKSKKNEKIIDENTEEKFLGIILKGKTSTKANVNSDEVILYDEEVSDVFGQSLVYSIGDRSNVEVVSLTNTVYLKLDEISNKWIENMPPVRTGSRDEIQNPLFVWWHTLSHAIINSLANSCGYNSSSLRERVYINSEGLGGILIYNTSPGDDSCMGGLVESAKSFANILNNAINSLLDCSNDPLCSSIKYEKGSVNGAACHNCLLISETSCEHQNTLLDRHFFD